MYEITYNGVSSKDMGVSIPKRPVLVTSEEEVTTYRIAGRDGAIVGKRYRAPTEIPIEMNFMRKLRYFDEDAYEIMRWLRGSGNLETSENDDYYRKVLYVKISDKERETRRTSKFTATFTCEPYRYMRSGNAKLPVTTKGKTLGNQFDESHPVYIITQPTEFSVNGNKFTVDTTDTVIIDTDRMIAFSESGENLNTRITGEYEDGWLVHGINRIETNAPITVIPQWRLEE